MVKNVNEKLVNQLIETERQCWTNAQYSREKYLEVAGIPTSIPNDLLEANVSKIFDKLGVNVEVKYIQACHRLKDNDRAIVKFSNRENSLQIISQISGPNKIRISWGQENLHKWESLCLLLWSVEQM